jgi:ATP/maltotriose-dependent transcriptional regulator MalT
MCIGIAGSPLRALADTYRRLGRETARKVNVLTIEDFVLRRTAIYDIGLGRWQEVEAAMQRTSQLTQQHGNPFLHEENLNTLASMAFHHGEFARSKPLFASEYQSTRRTKNRMHQCWSLLGQGENAVRTGQFNEASMLLSASLDILQKDRLGDVITLIQVYGLLAATALRQGKYRNAFDYAEKNMEYIVRSAPSVYALLDGYAGTAEVYLTLVEENRYASENERRDYLRKAAQTSKKLAQLAVVAPIARPRALLCSGLLEMLNGKTSKATKQWLEGIAAAVSLDLPYERAALLDRMARHRDADDALRATDLAQAKDIFLALGATYDYTRVSTALGGDDKLATTTLTVPTVQS